MEMTRRGMLGFFSLRSETTKASTYAFHNKQRITFCSLVETTGGFGIQFPFSDLRCELRGVASIEGAKFNFCQLVGAAQIEQQRSQRVLRIDLFRTHGSYYQQASFWIKAQQIMQPLQHLAIT